jgi:hypothetical protein
MNKTVSLCVATLMLGGASDALAQRCVETSGHPPRRELAVHVTALDDRGSAGGGRATRNYKDWMAGEIGMQVSRRAATDGPVHGLLLANAKLAVQRGARTPTCSNWVFLTAGAGIGAGFRDAWSPMIGIGVQSRWMLFDHVAFRGDLQFFPRAKSAYDRSRLLMGVAIGWGR